MIFLDKEDDILDERTSLRVKCGLGIERSQNTQGKCACARSKQEL